MSDKPSDSEQESSVDSPLEEEEDVETPLLKQVIQKIILPSVNAHFWQKSPMAEKAQQYERKQQSKDHWARKHE